MTASMTIDEALKSFLAEQQEQLAPRTFRKYEDVIDLLRRCLSGYGPNILVGADRDRWQQAYDDGDEDAFCTRMSAGYIADMMPEFLGYYMIRKVAAGQDLLRASGTVTKKLIRWLQDQGVIDSVTADERAEQAAEAARDLPKAELLSDALHELSEATPIDDLDVAEPWVGEGMLLRITKVETGELWFEDDIGPLPVPRAVSRLAQQGWSVNAVLAYARNRWWLVEVGSVYP